MSAKDPKSLRSRAWFDDPADPGMTALYIERYLNYGLTREELQSGKPIIGIAQTGSDLSPCNRHHIDLAKRVRDGIRDAGGIAAFFRRLQRRPTRRGTPSLTLLAKEFQFVLGVCPLTDVGESSFAMKMP